MEFNFMHHLFEDKEIVNPMNPEEVFSCTDLRDDYKICRRERRMRTSMAGQKVNCSEYRKLGKFEVIFISYCVIMRAANQCFYMDE